jgi:RecA-family ATPase
MATKPNGRPNGDVLRHASEAEASILGGVLINNEVLGLLDDLAVGDFFDPRHQVVFAAMRNLQTMARPIDVVTLENEIVRAGKLDAIGGAAFFGELALRVPTVDNVEHYVSIVRMHARNRAAEVMLASALHRVRAGLLDPAEIVIETAGELARFEEEHARERRSDRARWIIPLETFLGEEEPDEDDSLDWIIRDVVPRAEPCMWAGPQKSGKTWAALDLAIAVALGESWLGAFTNTWGGPARVLCIFLEDNQRRLRKRIWELARGRHKTPNDPALREHLRISRSPLRLPDAKDQRQLAAELKQWKPALVILDNLTRVMVGDPNSTREAAMFTRAWTELGEDAGCTVQFLHHTKKPMEGTGDLDPFDQVRGSGDFGATARNIIVSKQLKHETEKLSEVRIRGNIDLQREGFVMRFERERNPLGQRYAKLLDRGDISEVKEEVTKQRKDDKEAKKLREAEELFQKRKNRALEIAHRDGHVTQMALANAFGLSSERSMAPVFARMVREKLLEGAGKQGYVIAGTSRQEGML